jgi:hypothetical protein
MNEDLEEGNIYAVDVKCVKTGWYIREPIGKEFLLALIENDDLTMYEIESM